MKKIPLTQGKVALVDDEDFERINQFKWHCHGHKATKNRGPLDYALRNIRIGSRRTTRLMHREILNLTPEDPGVDHWDRNGLNNQKTNLRPASQSQNLMNQLPGRSNTGYKGVFVDRRCKKIFGARVTFNGQCHYTSFFDTPEEAALAYNKKAIELFGEFARLNPV